MKAVRSLARPLLAGVFIYGGLDVLRNPGPRATMAKPVVDRISAAVPIAPKDPVAAVTLNATVQVGAGLMMAAGVLPRVAAAALAGSIIPTTVGGHRFWEAPDQASRAQQRVHFLKNTAILGGLLLAAFD